MAQLPPDGTWLMQEVGGTVILFHRYTEEEIIRLDPGDPASVETAFRAIAATDQLDEEAKCFAYFWAGYFGGYAFYPPPPEGGRVSYDKGKGQVVVTLGGDPPVHAYDAGDRDLTAQAQAVIAFSATVPDADKPMAHFWCGYFWATVGGEG